MYFSGPYETTGQWKGFFLFRRILTLGSLRMCLCIFRCGGFRSVSAVPRIETCFLTGFVETFHRGRLSVSRLSDCQISSGNLSLICAGLGILLQPVQTGIKQPRSPWRVEPLFKLTNKPLVTSETWRGGGWLVCLLHSGFERFAHSAVQSVDDVLRLSASARSLLLRSPHRLWLRNLDAVQLLVTPACLELLRSRCQGDSRGSLSRVQSLAVSHSTRSPPTFTPLIQRVQRFHPGYLHVASGSRVIAHTLLVLSPRGSGGRRERSVRGWELESQVWTAQLGFCQIIL